MKRFLAALAFAFVATSVVYMPVCNLAFGCGCSWPWSGGVQHCDIHVPGPPDCPICTGGLLPQVGFFALIAAPMFLCAWGGARVPERLRARRRELS